MGSRSLRGSVMEYPLPGWTGRRRPSARPRPRRHRPGAQEEVAAGLGAGLRIDGGHAPGVDREAPHGAPLHDPRALVVDHAAELAHEVLRPELGVARVDAAPRDVGAQGGFALHEIGRGE